MFKIYLVGARASSAAQCSDSSGPKGKVSMASVISVPEIPVWQTAPLIYILCRKCFRISSIKQYVVWSCVLTVSHLDKWLQIDFRLLEIKSAKRSRSAFNSWSSRNRLSSLVTPSISDLTLELVSTLPGTTFSSVGGVGCATSGVSRLVKSRTFRHSWDFSVDMSSANVKQLLHIKGDCTHVCVSARHGCARIPSLLLCTHLHVVQIHPHFTG